MSGKLWVGLGIAAGLAILLAVVNGPMIPERDTVLKTGELVCLDCHRQPNINTNEGVASSQAFCIKCHGSADCSRVIDGQPVSLQIPAASLEATPHRYVACVHCHTDVARSPHRSDIGARCASCHPAHGESTAHAPHLRVDCQACHFNFADVRLDNDDHRVKLGRVDDRNQPMGLVDHGLSDASDNQTCRRCHNRQNAVGAPAVVLPAKSLLCIVCHPSPVAVGHPMFWVALVVMIAGLCLMVGFWLKGSVQGEEKSLRRKISLGSESIWDTIFSRQIFTLVKVFFLDILLQRRILSGSVQRWSMHSLIYLAIIARFLLSITTGLLFSLYPDGDLAMALMDKNNGITAFVYDFLGVCILTGIVWAVVQRFVIKPAHVVTEIADNITLGLLGLLIVAGFLATGARLLLTQVPVETAVASFVGFPIAKVLGLMPIDWRVAYPYLWYAHAVLGAAFVAYLPFGKLKHIFNVPLTYFMEEVSGINKEQRV